MNGTQAGGSDLEIQDPDEEQLRRDIRYFERQIARLASPNSAWEHGALKCYQVLVTQRRELLRKVESRAKPGPAEY